MYIRINRQEFPKVCNFLSEEYHKGEGNYSIKGDYLFYRGDSDPLDKVKIDVFFASTQNYILVETSKLWFKLYYDLSKLNVTTISYNTK